MRGTRGIASFCLAALAALLLSTGAMAQTPAPTTPAAPAATPAKAPSVCSQYPGLTNRIALCIQDSVDKATTNYFTGFYKLVSRGITAFITLGLIVFGILAASGSIEQPGRDSIMLLMKIAFIGYLTTHVDVMYKQTTSLMDAAAAAAVSYTPGAGLADNANSDFSQVECLKNMQKGSSHNGRPNGPWLGIDCIVDSVIGIKTSDVGKNGGGLSSAEPYYNDKLKKDDKGVSRGMMYLFFSGMMSSIMGAIFAAIGFLFIYGLVFLIAKVLLIYLTAYIGIAVLMIISPLFIPLVLLPRTKEYFDKWVKLVISFALQPVIMLVFVSMSIAAVDLAAFSGDYSLAYRVAGDESRKPGFSLNEYLTGKQAIIKKPKIGALVTSNATGTSTVDTSTCQLGDRTIDRWCASKCTTEGMKDPAVKKACDAAYPIQVWKANIDWKKLAEVRTPAVVISQEDASADPPVTPAQQISREALSSVIFCAIVVFVMNQLLRVIPAVAVDLVGDIGQSPNLSNPNPRSRGDNPLRGALGTASKGFTEALKGLGGTARGSP